jgi:hypothetical protein
MPVTKTIIRNTLLGLTVLPVLALTACGDGWEVKPYDGVPYTHERTAGRGVEYVRASMLPEKPANTTVMMKKEETVVTPAAVAPPPPVKTTGDAVFSKKQSK